MTTMNLGTIRTNNGYETVDWDHVRNLVKYTKTPSEAPQRYSIRSPILPEVWEEIIDQAKQYGPRAADFIRAVMESMNGTESQWEAIVKGRQLFLSQGAMRYQKRIAREAIERAAATQKTFANEAVAKAIGRMQAEEQAKASEHFAQQQRDEREQAERYAKKENGQERLLEAVLERLSRPEREPLDLKELAKIIRDVPAPVVKVEAPSMDAKELGKAIGEAVPALDVDALAKAIADGRKARTISVKKNKDGEYKIESE